MSPSRTVKCSCPYCGHEARRDAVLAHARRVHPDQPVPQLDTTRSNTGPTRPCPICGKQVYTSGVQRHIRRMHGDPVAALVDEIRAAPEAEKQRLRKQYIDLTWKQYQQHGSLHENREAA